MYSQFSSVGLFHSGFPISILNGVFISTRSALVYRWQEFKATIPFLEALKMLKIRGFTIKLGRKGITKFNQ